MPAEHQPQHPTRLVQHFQNLPSGSEASGWSQLWNSNEDDMWDRGRPSPPLINFIEKGCHSLLPRRPQQRLRAFVPGCGKGYDVAMLARHGFDVVGLEVAEKGVEVARNYIRNQVATIQAQPEPDADVDSSVGNVSIVLGDFFKRDWEHSCATDGRDCRFDLIYDYTFLCALPPSQRHAWANRVHDLLSPSGILVCLEFPLFKDCNALGPPWPLQGVYWDLLAMGGDGLRATTQQENSLATEGRPREGHFQRILYESPEESYEQGRGTDMLSVWRVKRDGRGLGL